MDTDQPPFTIPRPVLGTPPCSVEVRGLYLSYKRKSPRVLDNVDLRVRQGTIYGLLGPSGCGKTTLLNCLVGRLRPDGGDVRVLGRAPGSSGSLVPGRGVGYMPQELALYPEISIEETLWYFGLLHQMNGNQIKRQITFLVEFLHLPQPDRLVETLSGGQKRRVSLAAALIHMPPLLILDEPTVGVDPLLRQSIWDHLTRLTRERNMTVIITTHYIEEASLAHMVGLMRDSKILAQDSPAQLMIRHQAPTLEAVFLKLCLQNRDIDDVDDPSKILVPSNFPPHSSKQDQKLHPHVIGEASPLLKSYQKSSDGCLKDNTSKLVALLNKNCIRIRRSIKLLLWQFLMPTIQIILFCLCMGNDPYGLPLAIFNEDIYSNYNLGEMFLQNLDSKTINQIPYHNMESAIASVKRGESWGVLHIRSNFSETITGRVSFSLDDDETIEQSTITLYLDMTNQQITYILFKKTQEAFFQFAVLALNKTGSNPNIATPPIVLGEPIYGESNPTFTEFMAPGFIISISYGMPLGLTAIIFILDKKEGLLNRSWVAGVKAWHVMLAHFISQFLIMVIQLSLVLAVAFLVFHVPVRGAFYLVVLIVLLQGTCGMSFGLLLSAINKDEMSAIMMALGSFYTNLLLSGTIWPVESMPWALRMASLAAPQTVPLKALRSVVSRGLGFLDPQVWPGLAVSSGWIVVFCLLALFIFRASRS